MRLIDADKLISDLNNPDLCNVTPKLLEIVNEQPTITLSAEWLDNVKMGQMLSKRILRRLSGDGGKKMNKNLFWQYHEVSDSYDLYFNAFGDENIIAGIADTGDGWEYGSTLLGVDNDFLDADNLEDAQSEMLDLIEQHYQDEIDYYEELLSQFKETRRTNNNEH